MCCHTLCLFLFFFIFPFSLYLHHLYLHFSTLLFHCVLCSVYMLSLYAPRVSQRSLSMTLLLAFPFVPCLHYMSHSLLFIYLLKKKRHLMKADHHTHTQRKFFTTQLSQNLAFAHTKTSKFTICKTLRPCSHHGACI